VLRILEGAEVGIFDVKQSSPLPCASVGGYKNIGYTTPSKSSELGYVGVGQSSKMVVLDLRIPPNPVPVGEADTSDVPLAIDVAGNYASLQKGQPVWRCGT